MCYPNRGRGFALIVVLWTLAPLALIGAQLMASSRGHSQRAAAARDTAAAEAAANGALRHAMFQIRRGRWDVAAQAVYRLRIGDAAVT